jgi:hypothetical protein
VNEIAAPSARTHTQLPSSYTDRSALSEAWYRALYGADRGPSQSPNSNAGARSAASHVAPAARAQADGSAEREAHTPRDVSLGPVRARRLPACTVAYGLRAERRAPPTVAERAWRAAVARRLEIALRLPDGAKIELLVQQRGRHVHVLALSDASSAARTESALVRARAALSQHGIRLEIDPRLKGMS